MTIFRSRSLWLLAALTATAMLLAACQPQKQVLPPGKPEPGPVRRAENALEQEDFRQARELFFQALQDEELSREHRLRAWRGLARSALEIGQLRLARSSLQQWRILDPKAVDAWPWQRIKADLIREREGTEAYASYLEDLLDPERPWSLAVKAGKALTELHAEREDPKRVLDALERLHKAADAESERDEVVELARGIVSDMPGQTRTELLESLSREASRRFPGVILSWEQALQRFQRDEAPWRQTWRDLAGILEETQPYFRTRLAEELRRLEEEHGRPAPGVVLLLPMSGGYGNIGWKILRGADAAQWRMSKQGQPLRLKVINTREDGWKKRLSRLTATYSLVGGPIRQSSWKEVHRAGLHQELAFFTFRSGLHRGTEGKDAYRFFPGRRDQVEALLEVSRKELGLSSFGVFYPRSTFGRSMARSFWNATMARGAELNALDCYTPQSVVGFEDEVADYLKVPENYTDEEQPQNATQNATRIPKPDFEAVFIPDSFSRARILIPEFFYFNQPDLVFLGPAMWGQEIKRISGLDTRYYNLTLMASPWWPDNPAPQLKRLRQTLDEGVQEGPAFWVGLGYDFLRFVAQLSPSAVRGEKEDLSRELAGMTGFEWSMAPISWNEAGKASQDLFVLRPVSDGVKRVESGKMQERLKEARKRQREWRARIRGNATAGNATAGQENATMIQGVSTP